MKKILKYFILLLVVVVSCCPNDDSSSKLEPIINDFTIVSNDYEWVEDATFMYDGLLGVLTTNKTTKGIDISHIDVEKKERLERFSFLQGLEANGVQILTNSGTYLLLVDQQETNGIRNVNIYRSNLKTSLQLVVKIPSEHDEYAVKMMEYEPNSFIILARRKDKVSGTWGFVLYQYKNGELSLSKAFPHSVLLSTSDMVMHQGGSRFYVFGHVVDDPTKPTDFTLYEFDLNFEINKKLVFGGNEYQEARKMKLDPFGNVFLFGHSADEDILHNMVLMKFDSDLNKIYEKHYGSEFHDGGQTFQILEDQSFSIVGRTNAPNNTNESIYYMKLNNQAQVEFQQILGDDFDNRADVILDYNGVEYIIGNHTSGNVKNIQVFTITKP